MAQIQRKVHVYCAEEQGRQRGRVRERVSRQEGERWSDEGRQREQAGSFKEFVKRQSLSLIMRFREAPPLPLFTSLSPLSRMLVKTRRQFFPALPRLSTAIALHKGEKRMPKSQKRRAE